MKYEYASGNRIQTKTYPDGEVVHYDYNLGGMLEKVSGQVKVPVTSVLTPIQSHSIGHEPDGLIGGGTGLGTTPDPGSTKQSLITASYRYIDSIAYNEFELKREVFYGNGTHAQYGYDDIQRLQTLQSQTSASAAMQNIIYSYDAMSDITEITNVAGALSNGLGRTNSHHYEYDDLYRLIYSFGQRDNTVRNEHLKDTVRMSYQKNGRIVSKSSYANIYTENGSSPDNTTRSSKCLYHYNFQNPIRWPVSMTL